VLLRWLILHLCATRGEIRLVLRMVTASNRTPADGSDAAIRPAVRRGIRRLRLALLAGVLMVHAENPRLVAGALIVLPIATLLLNLRLMGILR
jgi:hypothetical protein